MSLYASYIKTDWYDKIKTYQYRSTDHSLLYNYVTSPLCNILVEYIPDYIAYFYLLTQTQCGILIKKTVLNQITCTGLLCVVLLNFLTGIYSGLDGKGDIPTWVMIASAILYPIYHLLDLIDGKQARRTKNSSPLGLLVDHGCDGLTTFMISMSIGSIVKLSGIVNYVLIWSLVSIPFFFCTWEEYHTGLLELPCFNGVNEGTVISSGVMFFTAVVGQSFWLNSFKIGSFILNYNELLLYSSIGLSIVFTLIRYFFIQ